jgi:mono/diheme cytochrome c family protein
MNTNRSLLAAAAVLAIALGATRAEPPTSPTKPAEVAATAAKAPVIVDAPAYQPTYVRDVLPIVMGKCFRCHNPESHALYNWSDYKTAFKDRAEIKRRVWDSWKGHYYKQSMPAGSVEKEAITEVERALIRDWVLCGAEYGTLPPPGSGPKTRPERMEVGQRLFSTVCSACHQSTGQGIPDRFPPLAGSDFLNANKRRAIRVLIKGLQGEVTVNGHKFNNSMPSLPLSDDEIASALTFVYNAFGNSGKDVTADEVKTLRTMPDDAPGLDLPRAVANAPVEKSAWE